jgi:hypothetical protein
VSTDAREPATTDPFARVPRLDPVRAVAVIAAATGIEFDLDGRTSEGEVGGAYVRWPDRHRSVLTMGIGHVAPLLDRARAAGVPAPAYELVVPDADVTYLVQTLLPGTPPRTVDATLVDQMVAVNGRLAGLLAGRPDLTSPSLYLGTSGPGFCVHEPLARYDRRTATVLAWVHDVGADIDVAAGDDLMHLDFHPGNVLTDGRTITGVVDWDGASRGDGRLDLVTLRFDLALRAPDLVGYVDDVIAERLPDELLRAYWAHMSLRLVDWSIRHHTAADVDFWLAQAGYGRRRFGGG